MPLSKTLFQPKNQLNQFLEKEETTSEKTNQNLIALVRLVFVHQVASQTSGRIPISLDNLLY